MLTLLKSLPVFALMTISVAFVTLADYFGKKWSIDQRTLLLVVACCCSLLSGLFYYPILIKDGLVVTSIIWTFLSMVAFILIGFLVFHETISMFQVIGLILGVISVILLSI